MSTFSFDSVIETTKIFSQVIEQGGRGPSGPAATSAINLSRTTVDLDPFKTIIDDLLNAPVFITDRTKPASPQYTYTIQPGQVPTSADIQDYMLVLTIGGQNTDVSDDNLNWIITLNGVDIGGSDGLQAVTADLYWTFVGVIASAPIAVGDVIGVKFWTDASDLLNFAYATLYIVPQTLSIPGGFQLTIGGTNYTQGIISGAIPGTTYENTSAAPSLYDSDLALVVANIGTGVSNYGEPLQAISIMASQLYLTDNSFIAADIQASPFLYRITGGSFLRILQNYNFTVGNPVFAGTPIFESLTGTIDGTTGFDGNDTFTLSHIPLDPNQIKIFNKLLVTQGALPDNGFNYSAPGGVPTIIFNAGFIPITGDKPKADYIY